ncbi:unnamed protein product [Pelagomonas calceolata]|uniref:Uncharacterized protein n=2 Tax=Pelagomonas calceolata TaxID=35677 RepID=A0A8J2SDB9_9STRA|nr:unnamed protein product [Pelagomonas calceolata]
MDPCRFASEPRVRLRYLGVVGLGCLVMQLLAVLPYKNCKHGCEHWATVSDSNFDSREIPDEIPNRGYDYHHVSYNLWNAIEGFCTYAPHWDECEWVTTEILGRGGGREDEYCRGRGEQCEDHFAATNTARATTCVALIFTGIVGLGILFVNIRAHLVGRGLEASPKAIFGAAAVLAVGGVVGLAGAANYRSTVAAAVEKGYVSLRYGSFGHRGCDLSLYGGLVAMVVGMAFAAYEAYFNREELRGTDVKEPDDVDEKVKTSEAKSADLAPLTPTTAFLKSLETRRPAKPETEAEPEPEADAEEPGFVGKLSSFLFGEQEPVAESEGVVVSIEPKAEGPADEKETYNRIADWYDKPENAALRATWGPYPKLEEFQAWPGFVQVTNAFLDAEV